ncbi:MAG: hypothetical protein DWI68_02945, partial [Chloroflexi bacterium]
MPAAIIIRYRDILILKEILHMPAPEEISAQIAAQIATAILKTPRQPPALDAALISSGLIDSF